MPIRFSVLIATYNRLDCLTDLLDAWLLVECPEGGYEIILADDGSWKSPDTIIHPYYELLPLRFLRLPHGGISATRQAALEAALGQYVLFTDDDCRPTPGLLRHYERAVTSSPTHAMGGPVVNLLADNLFSEATQAIMSYITITWNRRSGHATFFTCSNLLLPRKKLIEIGGFDRFWQGAGEDRDLCRRWCEHDLPMSMVPQAAVGHAHRLNIWSFLQQHFNYGVGRWWCEQRRTKPHLGPPMWSGLPFYFNLLLYPFDRYPLLQAVSVSVLIGFAQLATAAGYCKARYV